MQNKLENKQLKVMICLSGGIDSAVSALLLTKAGYRLQACFARCFADDSFENCSDKDDMLSAIAIAEQLNLEIEVLDLREEYKNEVFTPFIEAYQNALTPNPDILCNSQVKFKHMAAYAKSQGCDYMATGHYAISQKIPGSNQPNLALYKAVDVTKDQSYFLHCINDEQLAYSIFPLGKWHKHKVKKLAAEATLINANRKESMGICFIGKRNMRQFLSTYITATPGNIVDEQGKVLGEHPGIEYFTIGQRKGLGLGGPSIGWHVAQKKADTNELIVVDGGDHPLLYNDKIKLTNCFFRQGDYPYLGRVYEAKYRHGPSVASCFLQQEDDNLYLRFAQKQFALASGQYAVIYDGDRCIGGGIMMA